MGRYLIMWEADESKIPLDPKERKAGWLAAIEMTKQLIKDGKIKYWGGFVGQTKGFNIVEDTEENIHSDTAKLIPYFRFKVYPLISFEKAEKVIKAM
jgi:hypothetical protein